MRKDPELSRLSNGPSTCQGEEKDSLSKSLPPLLGRVRKGPSIWQEKEKTSIPGRVKKNC
jgi:hypothetical protein